MYRHHPQWQAALKIVREGQIGDLVNVNSVRFSSIRATMQEIGFKEKSEIL